MLCPSVVLLGLASSAVASTVEGYNFETLDKVTHSGSSISGDQKANEKKVEGTASTVANGNTINPTRVISSSSSSSKGFYKSNSTTPYMPGSTGTPRKGGNSTHHDHEKGSQGGKGGTSGGKTSHGGKGNSTATVPTATPTATRIPSEGYLVGPSAAGGWVTVAGLGVAFAVFM